MYTLLAGQFRNYIDDAIFRVRLLGRLDAPYRIGCLPRPRSGLNGAGLRIYIPISHIKHQGNGLLPVSLVEFTVLRRLSVNRTAT